MNKREKDTRLCHVGAPVVASLLEGVARNWQRRSGRLERHYDRSPGRFPNNWRVDHAIGVLNVRGAFVDPAIAALNAGDACMDVANGVANAGGVCMDLCVDVCNDGDAWLSNRVIRSKCNVVEL